MARALPTHLLIRDDESVSSCVTSRDGGGQGGTIQPGIPGLPTTSWVVDVSATDISVVESNDSFGFMLIVLNL